jgi:hypothetical protein
MTTMLAAALSALLVFSAVAVAAKPNQEAKKFAQQQCKAEKKADKGAFKAYHGERAMRTCKKDAKDELKQEVRNAAQECKEERSSDPDGFKNHGDNENGQNAFGKCVSSKVKAEVSENVETFKNAAKECRDLRSSNPTEFEGYGDNKNGKNAFGKCVSSKVKDAERGNGGRETS